MKSTIKLMAAGLAIFFATNSFAATIIPSKQESSYSVVAASSDNNVLATKASKQDKKAKRQAKKDAKKQKKEQKKQAKQAPSKPKTGGN